MPLKACPAPKACRRPAQPSINCWLPTNRTTGNISLTSNLPVNPVVIENSTIINARVRLGEQWSPLANAGIRDALASNSGMTSEQVADCPLFLTGPGSEIRDRLQTRREQTGISYVVIQGKDEALLEQFAEEVVEPLSGT